MAAGTGKFRCAAGRAFHALNPARSIFILLHSLCSVIADSASRTPDRAWLNRESGGDGEGGTKCTGKANQNTNEIAVSELHVI